MTTLKFRLRLLAAKLYRRAAFYIHTFRPSIISQAIEDIGGKTYYKYAIKIVNGFELHA